MEFDKSRVYTAVNADELPIGSKCIFADDLNMLHKKVQHVESYTSELIGIREDCELYRFRGTSDEQDEGHALAYFIEPPKEPQYKPFSSVEKAIETIRKHGCFLQSEKIYSFIATHLTNCDCVYLGGYWLTLKDLYENFIFADDGSPCGELVEE